MIELSFAENSAGVHFNSKIENITLMCRGIKLQYFLTCCFIYFFFLTAAFQYLKKAYKKAAKGGHTRIGQEGIAKLKKGEI